MKTVISHSEKWLVKAVLFYLVLLPCLIEKFRLCNKIKKDRNKNKKIIWVIHSESFLEFHEDYFCD